MRMDRFDMERTQCLYENAVRWNLSESGVEPLRVEELLGEEYGAEELLGQALKYPESNGSARLRERIADFYPGAAAENVLVTTGCSEANYTTLWGLLEKGDRAAIMIPSYLQGWGLARGYAGSADAYRLVEKRRGLKTRWALDVASLERAVGKKTRLIMVTNPNNPTGAVLTGEEMDAIVRVADRVGAWIVSDEVYRGAEVGGPPTSPTFWGRYRKVIVTAGLSKAFGMPGLRIGWIVAPPKTAASLWAYQDYTTLTPTILSDRLAAAALEPARRERILARTRAILARNLPEVERWIRGHGDLFDYIPPVAGAIVLVKYRPAIGSTALFDRLRLEQSVLVTPGSHFGIGRYLRIGYGYDPGKTREGLGRVDRLLSTLPASSRPGRRAASAR
ncbi:MAG TPA: aminotransferase class I/II-fold pyridoxal phosphate-dependent enzyme [Thermoanaerobaculia bacterium]|nr:aminotransferase class I/II-fold pyridoxal phosphate-dependent enzyme [Thermoanaerobaculia bacterium]